MRASKQPRNPVRRARVRALYCAVVLGCCLSGASLTARAEIFRCVGADGSSTFSDHPCETAKPSEAAPPAASGSPAGSHIYEQREDTPREKKAAHILDVLRIAPAEPEAILINRTVDDAAPDLVKSIDPDNGLWTPANGRWYSVSNFVKADLRRDVQTSLRSSTAHVSKVAARLYAERATEADIDALTKYLSTPDGTRYLAFQNEVRPLLYAALRALEEQEPASENVSSAKVLAQRRQLLSMALEICIAKANPAPATTNAGLQPGSNTVLENAIRREGATLDTLLYEYEPFLQSLQEFSDSGTAKRFFVAAEPALRTQLALSSTATTDFAEQEFDKYLQRWRGFYGPMRTTTRTTVIIRGRTILIARAVTTRILPGTQSAEAMAIQCENRENSLYLATHRNVDYNTRAAGLKAIQQRCRAEQRLPQL